MSDDNEHDTDDGNEPTSDHPEAVEAPQPTALGHEVQYNGDGAIEKVTCSIQFWDQDHDAIRDISFRVSNGRASFLGVDVPGNFYPEHDLVPLMVATDALQALDLDDIEDVETVEELVHQAGQEAARSTVRQGDGDD